ncbi:MAG: hypothetical protein ABI068_12730 [Ktedonobacterales bacterium]
MTASPNTTTPVPITQHHQPALHSARRFTGLDGAMLAVWALLIALHIVAAALRIGWVSAALMIALVSLALLALLMRRAWRPVVGRLLLFGLIAGILELFTDFAGETVAHSLFYPPQEPMLWASPAYLPLSWMVALTPLGYLAWRLRGLSPLPPRWASVVIVALVGAFNIPFYEEMAYYAGWWRYAVGPHIPHLGHTPLYVLLFEGLIAASLPLLLGGLSRLSLPAVALRGVLLGIWLPCAALIAWLLIGR